MLVDDKLAKEKLIDEIRQLPVMSDVFGMDAANVRNAIVELIRNTDLTDCQPPMENMMVTQAGNDPSATDSGCPRCDGPKHAAEDLLDGFRRRLEGEELMQHARRRLVDDEGIE